MGARTTRSLDSAQVHGRKAGAGVLRARAGELGTWEAALPGGRGATEQIQDHTKARGGGTRGLRATDWCAPGSAAPCLEEEEGLGSERQDKGSSAAAAAAAR